MRVNVQCSSCRKLYNVDDGVLGKSMKCRQCGAIFKLAAYDGGNGAKATMEPAPTPPAAVRPPSDPTAPVGASEAVQAAPNVPAPRPSNSELQHLARFEIRARLGAGAFGTVYRAFDPQLEREVALKVPQAGVLDSPKRVERFLREAKSAAQLRHPNIVPIYDAGQTPPTPPSQGGDGGGVYYIASAFIQGHTLSDVIDEKGMKPQRAAKIVAKLAEALAYAHQLGIVHRDIKPANVMIDEDDQPHLMDFGLAARTESTEKLTQDGAILGTPAYMAPEHAAGHSGESFPASDQYSLGVVLYELLTGRTPWEGPPQIVLYNVLHKEPEAPRKIRKDLPRDLETICLKAMAKKSEHRFRDCQAMADDLRRWLEGEPVKARRPNFGERFIRWCRREPKIAAATGLALAGAIMLAVGLGLLAQKLQGEYDHEQVAHGKTKKSLTDEKDEHQLTKGDRYGKQVSLAKQQIEGFDLLGGLQTLAACPSDLRAWEWGHLRLLAEGTPDAFQVLNGKGKVLHFQFSGDSKQLFSQHPNGTRMIWDLARIQAKDEKQKMALGPWAQVKFSADGQFVADVQNQPIPVPPDGSVKDAPLPPSKLYVRELATNKLVREIAIPGGMNVYALSGDGAKVAVANAAKFTDPLKVTIYDVQTGQETYKLNGEFTSVTDLVFNSDGATLAIVQGGVMIVTKKLVAEAVQKIVDGKTYTETVNKEVEVTQMIGSGCGVTVVDVATSKEHFAIKKDSTGVAHAVFAPDGKKFYFLNSDGVAVYSMDDAKELFTLRGRAGAIAFSPDGKRIATAAGNDSCPSDGLIRIWNAANGQFIVALRTKGYTNAYDKLLFSPDGAWLAAVPQSSSQIFLFSTSGGRLVTPYYEQGAPVVSVTWSPDGKLLSSWSDCNAAVHVWDGDDGKSKFIASNQFSAGLGFSTGGKFLATGGGCLGAVPHQGFGYGAHGGGHGCYGMPSFGGVKVFAVDGFKPMPAPKGYDTILAAGKDGKNWVVKPTFNSNGKPFATGKAPKPQLWNVADEKETLIFDELDSNSKAQFTDDGGRVVGVGTGMAKTTGYKPVLEKVKKVKTVQKVKDGKTYDESVEYEVTVCRLVAYEVSVFATHLKLLDVATGKKVWQSYGVDSLFAVSGDGKLVATLPPALPKGPMAMPAMPAPKVEEKKMTVPAPAPKVAPKKLPPPSKTEEAIAFQEPKKLLPAPVPIAPQGPGGPVVDMPTPMIPSPPITLWVVDEKDKDGEVLQRTLEMPGPATMMKFSPDGKYLAAYLPHIVECIPETHVRKAKFVIDGQIVEKDETYTTMRNRQSSMLIVCETATGKEVVRHVGASGLVIFCNGSGHIASAAGLPKFTRGHMAAPFAVPGGEVMPRPPGGIVDNSAQQIAEPPLQNVRTTGIQVASLSQEIVPAQPQPLPPMDDDPDPFGRPFDGMHAPPGMPYVDTTLFVFDLKTGKESHKFHGHTSQITALAFSPDCQKLASGSYGMPNSCGDPPGLHFAQIRIWDLSAKTLFQAIDGHTGTINCMEFDPEGKRLASASDDTTVKVWRVEASLNTTPTYAIPVGPSTYASPSYGAPPSVGEVIPSVAPMKTLGPPAFTPVPAPKFDVPPGNLVFDQTLLQTDMLDQFYQASGQYGGHAEVVKDTGLHLIDGHSSPIAWSKPFLGDRYRVQFEVKLKDNAWAGWCLSGSGSGNSPASGYRCHFNMSHFWIEREGQLAQQATQLPAPIPSDDWVKVMADVDGGKIAVVVGDHLVARLDHPTALTGPLHGWFGLNAVNAIYRNLKIWSTAKDTSIARQLAPPPNPTMAHGKLLYELKLADGKLGEDWWQSQPANTNVKAGALVLHGGNGTPDIVLTKPLPANLICEVEFEYASVPFEALNFSVLLWHAKKAPQSSKECDGGWLVHLPGGDGKSAVRWHRGPKDGGEGPWSDAPILTSTPYHAPVFNRKYVARIEAQGHAIRVFLDGGRIMTATRPPTSGAESLPLFLGLRQVFGGSTIHAVRVYEIPEANGI